MDDLEPGVLGTSENSQRRVLPNRGKAVGCCYSRSGQEGCITSQRCYGMTNRAERYPISHSVPLLSISTPRWLSLSSHHPKNIFYTHAWCSCLPCSPPPSGRAHQASAAALPAQGHPTNIHHGTTLAQEASAQHARSSATSFSKHRQSLFLVCLCRREQEAGSWSAGRRAQPFLSPPAFFSRDAPSTLALAAEPWHLLEHLSPCSRDSFACDQQAGACVSWCCSSNPFFVARP